MTNTRRSRSRAVSAFALAASEENARGHLGHHCADRWFGWCDARDCLCPLTQTKRALPQEKVRQGLLAGAAIGYLCKHNATLSGAEGGCQSEIGVASAMSAAFIASAMDASPLVTENSAESALEHHLGMTCDPVAGYVQVPCIERCAFGAVKAWTAYMIATNEIASRHRVDLDTTITTLAVTGKDMSTNTRRRAKPGWPRTLCFAEANEFTGRRVRATSRRTCRAGFVFVSGCPIGLASRLMDFHSREAERGKSLSGPGFTLHQLM